jgi:hypothetical protein
MSCFFPTKQNRNHALTQAVLPHPEQLVLQGFAEGELILRGCDIT